MVRLTLKQKYFQLDKAQSWSFLEQHFPNCPFLSLLSHSSQASYLSDPWSQGDWRTSALMNVPPCYLGRPLIRWTWGRFFQREDYTNSCKNERWSSMQSCHFTFSMLLRVSLIWQAVETWLLMILQVYLEKQEQAALRRHRQKKSPQTLPPLRPRRD